MKRARTALHILAAVTIVLLVVLAAWYCNRGSGSDDANNRAAAATETTGGRPGEASSMETDETDDPAHDLSAPVALQLDPMADDPDLTNADRTPPADAATGGVPGGLSKGSLLTEARRAEDAAANSAARTLSDPNDSPFHMTTEDGKAGENVLSEGHP